MTDELNDYFIRAYLYGNAEVCHLTSAHILEINSALWLLMNDLPKHLTPEGISILDKYQDTVSTQCNELRMKMEAMDRVFEFTLRGEDLKSQLIHQRDKVSIRITQLNRLILYLSSDELRERYQEKLDRTQKEYRDLTAAINHINKPK